MYLAISSVPPDNVLEQHWFLSNHEVEWRAQLNCIVRTAIFFSFLRDGCCSATRLYLLIYLPLRLFFFAAACAIDHVAICQSPEAGRPADACAQSSMSFSRWFNLLGSNDAHASLATSEDSADVPLSIVAPATASEWTDDEPNMLHEQAEELASPEPTFPIVKVRVGKASPWRTNGKQSHHATIFRVYLALALVLLVGAGIYFSYRAFSNRGIPFPTVVREFPNLPPAPEAAPNLQQAQDQPIKYSDAPHYFGDRLLPGFDEHGVCNASFAFRSSGSGSTQSVTRRRDRVLVLSFNLSFTDMRRGALRNRVSSSGGDAIRAYDESSEQRLAAPRPRRLATLPLHARRDAKWAAALSAARQLVANMTFDEKAAMVRGTGWSNYALSNGMFVGSIPAIPRLGIPSLNMQDGPQGFRTTDGRLVGTVTSWPSQLAVGATWSPALAFAYGKALGEEFRAKGANVILGWVPP